MTTLPRIGFGYDVHPFVGATGRDDDAESARPLVLGGVTIVDGPGLVGHSDADVVAHAVADALLSAAGLADIGTLFPASDDRYRGASSMQLLATVIQMVRDAHFAIGNVQVVLNAETPRLAPYLPAMVMNIEELLDQPGAVSIVAKRGEGIGFVGRAEGIQAWAVCLVNAVAKPSSDG